MKKLLSLLLALALVFSLTACGSKTDDMTTDDTQGNANAESVDLVVFAAASMTETLTQIAEMYKEVAPNVNKSVIFKNFFVYVFAHLSRFYGIFIIVSAK